MGDDDEPRRIGVATYYVHSEKEVHEAHMLARLAGYKRFAHLVFAVVDSKLSELRTQYGALLDQAEQGRRDER